MSVHLAAIPVCDGQFDLLASIEDAEATTQDFKDACVADGLAHDGWVSTNRVSAILHDRFPALKPQWLSSQWAPAAGANGFLDKTEREVPIDPKHSRGNGNKKVTLRRLRGWS